MDGKKSLKINGLLLLIICGVIVTLKCKKKVAIVPTSTQGKAPPQTQILNAQMPQKKIKVKDLLEIWSKLTKVNIDEIDQFIREEAVETAFKNDYFLIATAALSDQAPAKSKAQRIANDIFEVIREDFINNLLEIEKELSEFQDEFQDKFDEEELKWIRFLAGATVLQKFCYENSQKFREDSDINIDNNHDYIQAIFPSWSPSQYANKNLYLSHKANMWNNLLENCPTLKLNVQLNMQLNAIRMLHFWKFHFNFQDNKVILVDDLTSPLHREGDHNALRATRFIGAMRLFGCESILNLFKEILEKNYQDNSSYQYWSREWQKIEKL